VYLLRAVGESEWQGIWFGADVNGYRESGLAVERNASRTAIHRLRMPRPETTPRTAPCVMKAASHGDEEKSGLLSHAAGYQGAQVTSRPRYMRTMTRRNRSACCSQYGIR
jgi:hypothetical protein